MNKINQTIKNTINEHQFQKMVGCLGVISSYDAGSNTATVMITKEQTDEISDVIKNVMCPRIMGIQTVAPTAGLLCWVVFKDNNFTQPLITQYYNHRFNQFDYSKNVKSTNMLPSHLLGS